MELFLLLILLSQSWLNLYFSVDVHIALFVVSVDKAAVSLVPRLFMLYFLGATKVGFSTKTFACRQELKFLYSAVGILAVSPYGVDLTVDGPHTKCKL